MPIFEGYCSNQGCSRSRVVVQYLLRRHDLPDKPCPSCGTKVSRIVSKPNVIWSKPLGWYNGNKDDGHFVHGKDINGNAFKKYITTRQEQIAHCHEQGIYDPMEVDPTTDVNDRGLEELDHKCAWDHSPGALISSKLDDNWI